MLSPSLRGQINKPDFQLYIGKARVFYEIFQKDFVYQRPMSLNVDIVPQNRF